MKMNIDGVVVEGTPEEMRTFLTIQSPKRAEP